MLFGGTCKNCRFVTSEPCGLESVYHFMHLQIFLRVTSEPCGLEREIEFLKNPNQTSYIWTVWVRKSAFLTLEKWRSSVTSEPCGLERHKNIRTHFYVLQVTSEPCGLESIALVALIVKRYLCYIWTVWVRKFSGNSTYASSSLLHLNRVG